MKKISKNIIWFGVVAVIIANAFVFLHGLDLGNQIGQYERDIAKLRLENTDLEKKVYQKQSFTYATSMAAAMNYTKKIEPVYIENLLYAQN